MNSRLTSIWIICHCPFGSNLYYLIYFASTAAVKKENNKDLDNNSQTFGHGGLPREQKLLLSEVIFWHHIREWTFSDKSTDEGGRNIYLPLQFPLKTSNYCVNTTSEDPHKLRMYLQRENDILALYDGLGSLIWCRKNGRKWMRSHCTNLQLWSYWWHKTSCNIKSSSISRRSIIPRPTTYENPYIHTHIYVYINECSYISSLYFWKYKIN